MPFINSDGCRIYYRLDGLPENPLLVLVHCLGADHGMWDLQMPALLTRFQVLRLDLRGHGASDAPSGDYTIEQLGRDVLAALDAAIDATGREQFFCCGISLGGMIGQWLGANAGPRLQRLILANTSPRVADPALFEARRVNVLTHGMQAIAKAVMERCFSSRILNPPTAATASIHAALLATNPVGYAGCCAAIRDMDHRAVLADIKVPVLVISGKRDVSMPWLGNGEVLSNGIAGSTSVTLDAAP